MQTADERILPKGTAYLTDAGMTGPHDSIIGVTIEAALGRFVNGMPAKFESATGPGRLNAVIVTADQATGKATAIERLNLSARTSTRSRPQPPPGADAMADLFDQPFEDDEPRTAGAAHAAAASARVYSVSELTAAIRGLLETGVRRHLGRRRDLELPAVEHRPPVLHAQGRRRADQGGDVPLGGAVPEVQAGGRPARRSRAAGWASTSRRANTSSPASTWSRTGSARCSWRSSS